LTFECVLEESTWNYLCQNDKPNPYVGVDVHFTYQELQKLAHKSLESTKQRRPSFDQRLHAFGLAHRRSSFDGLSGLGLDNKKSEPVKYSQMELYAIKSAFSAINSIWRDVSMGTDVISLSTLKSIHPLLGEIGSDLFGSIFLKEGIPSHVISKT
jgi:hypothetical protein